VTTSQTGTEIDLAALPSYGKKMFRDLLTGVEYEADTDGRRLKVEPRECLLLQRGGI